MKTENAVIKNKQETESQLKESTRNKKPSQTP